MKTTLRIFGLFVLAAFAVGQANAQNQAPPPPGADPQQQQQQQGPPPDVARMSFIRGDVSMKRGDSGDWVALTLNTPLMSGDSISTADGARSEVQLDFANILRLSGHSQANIVGMGDGHIQIQVAQGLVEYSILKGADGDAEIDTPLVSIHPAGDGVYRIEVNEAGDTILIVRNGEAEVSTPDGSTKVGKGEMITVQGTGADVQFKKSAARINDEWDKWSLDRDRLIQNAEGTRQTNPYYTGAGDLDSNGTWENNPDYGQVWSPNVAPDWAPYRDGDWVWEPYYGWTWVAAEPWGWAPYHYGRWFNSGARWFWWPGPVYAGYRPLWAPAYVSFFGFGGRFGVGLGFGSIGWFPIGPCDPFFPWFGFGIRFGFADSFGFRGGFDARRFPGAIGPLGGRFNERYSNFGLAGRNPGIVSSMRAGEFGHGAVGVRAGVTASEFRGGQVMTGHVPVTPTRASLSATNRAANPSTIRNGGQQHFFGSTASRSSQRTSFNEQAGRVQEALRANGQASGGGQAGGINRGNGNGVANQGNRGNDRPAASQPSVRSFEGQGQRSQQSSQPAANSGGWQRFSPQSNEPSRGSASGGNQPSQPRYQGNSQAGNSRPALNLHRPIVNDRSQSGGNSRYSPPAPSRPSYTPPQSRSNGGNAPRYSPPPSRSSGGSAPRSSPAPSRSSGGSSHGSSGGSSHGGGGSHHH
jgi:hypothetical protein